MNIIFDVTDLRKFIQNNDILTGIQRVVVMTLIKSQDQFDGDTLWMGFYDHLKSEYRCVRFPDEFEKASNNILYLRKALNISSLPRPEKLELELYAKSLIGRHYLTKRLDLAAFRKRAKPFKKFGLKAEDWKKIRSVEKQCKDKYFRPELCLHHVIRKNDKIVLIDNTLQYENLVPYLLKAKAEGCEIFTFVHDLIPIFLPNLVANNGSEKFYEWLVESIKFTSVYVANSKNTLKDLDTFLKCQGVDIRRTAIPLAQQNLTPPRAEIFSFNELEREFLGDFVSSYGISSHIKKLAKVPFVLVVGTQEVRKNLWRVATVWDKIRKQGISNSPKLIIVGRKGWSNNDFDALMQGTGFLGGWLEVIEDANDFELDWLYRRCLFTISASIYEGWGLPIGESLSHGKTAVVSHTSSMPEVGLDLVEYCDPYDLDSIYQACLRLISDEAYRLSLEKKIADTKLRLWSDFSYELSQLVRTYDQQS